MKNFIIFAALALVVASIPVNTFAAKSEADSPVSPVVDYIYEVRLAYGSCNLASHTSILNAELEAAKSGDDAQYDFSRTYACRKVQGAVVTQKLKGALKEAAKDKPLTEAIIKLQRYWVVVMTSSTIPSASDSESSFKQKGVDANQTLKEMGNNVLSTYCKNDFNCIDEKGEKLNGFDGVL